MNLIDQRSNPFYDPYECLDQGSREIVQKKLLQEIITYTQANSTFYTERLRAINVNDSNPLLDVPLLTANDLRQSLPPQGDHLLSSSGPSYTVFQSGGTTGVPKTSLFTHDELELINLCNARGFYATGLKASDRVANLWAVGGLYMTFVHMNRVLQQYGCTNFPFSNQTPVDFIHTVAKLFKINCFTGITSVVLNTLREIHQKDPGCLNVEKIYFGGEHIYQADRQEMEEKFGVKIIRAPGYGTIDSWYLGYQCEHTTNGIFHAFDDMVYLEIIDEETGKPSKVGLLVATVLKRKLTPIIRMRVGDKARWLKRPCPCGRTTPLFELLGRGDDVLRIGYDSIDYSWVQQIILDIPGATSRLQMEKLRIEGKDQLILRIETEAKENEYPKMSQKLTEIFIAQRPSFYEFLKKGTVLPLKVEWKKPGTIAQNIRTGKLIRVIDAI